MLLLLRLKNSTLLWNHPLHWMDYPQLLICFQPPKPYRFEPCSIGIWQDLGGWYVAIVLRDLVYRQIRHSSVLWLNPSLAHNPLDIRQLPLSQNILCHHCKDSVLSIECQKNFAKTHSLPPNAIYKIAQWVTNTQVGLLLNILYHNHLYCIQKGYSYNVTHAIF